MSKGIMLWIMALLVMVSPAYAAFEEDFDYTTNYALNLPMFEGSGSTTEDVGGLDNNGTITNAAWAAECRFNECLKFDDNGDFVNVSNYGPPVNTGDFTVSFWAYVNESASGSDDGLVGMDERGSHEGWVMWLAPTLNRLHVVIIGQDKTKNYNPTTLTVGEWNYVTLAYKYNSDPGIWTYIDGVLVNTTPSTGIGVINNTQDLLMGSRSVSQSITSFNGTLDEVKIFSKALSAEEVEALYNGTTPFVNRWNEPTGYWDIYDEAGDKQYVDTHNVSENHIAYYASSEFSNFESTLQLKGENGLNQGLAYDIVLNSTGGPDDYYLAYLQTTGVYFDYVLNGVQVSIASNLTPSFLANNWYDLKVVNEDALHKIYVQDSSGDWIKYLEVNDTVLTTGYVGLYKSGASYGYFDDFTVVSRGGGDHFEMLIEGQIFPAIVASYQDPFPLGYKDWFWGLIVMLTLLMIAIKTKHPMMVGIFSLIAGGVLRLYLPREFHISLYLMAAFGIAMVLYKLVLGKNR